MAYIVYVNTGGEESVLESDLVDIDAAGFLVDMSAVVSDSCGMSTAAEYRPALQRALRRVAEGDTLLVTRLHYFGNSIGDIVGTLRSLANRNAHAVCLEFGRASLTASGADSPLRALELAVEVERMAKRARALAAAAEAKRMGLPQGRPASLTHAQRAQALRALAAGKTVTAVAQALNTSRQTIIRLRNANARNEPDTPGES
ncbi:recombinase family protein [Caballeronia humi]|uniref:Resolvase domain-containing protein n=1 Tax=Caballeronia humi TaxID=326474 RepID=A0A158FYF3_9BURK|nr:recombinase family protein [Caballeronia humi]SAL24687.1 resolvase domain-containing protein [Caballeronia humi]